MFALPLRPDSVIKCPPKGPGPICRETRRNGDLRDKQVQCAMRAWNNKEFCRCFSHCEALHVFDKQMAAL